MKTSERIETAEKRIPIYQCESCTFTTESKDVAGKHYGLKHAAAECKLGFYRFASEADFKSWVGAHYTFQWNHTKWHGTTWYRFKEGSQWYRGNSERSIESESIEEIMTGNFEKIRELAEEMSYISDKFGIQIPKPEEDT